MAKDGLGIIVVGVVLALVLTTGAVIKEFWLLKALAFLSWIFLGFSLYFFRDPERTIPSGEDLIVSAGDGTVIEIKQVFEEQYLKAQAIQVSIFLSVFNVHINRVPMSGRVGFFHYQRGKFVQAYKHSASKENEQTIIGIENEHAKLVVKQIAGILARRIICQLKEGDMVSRGARFGMIKFGSRVDLMLPLSTEIKVQLHQKVKGGETIIAKIKID